MMVYHSDGTLPMCVQNRGVCKLDTIIMNFAHGFEGPSGAAVLAMLQLQNIMCGYVVLLLCVQGY
jgi:hypothetical protein